MPGDRYVCATCGRPSGDPLCCPLPLDPAKVRELVEAIGAWAEGWTAEGREVTTYSDAAECCGHGIYRTGGEMECCGNPERVTDRDVLATTPNERIASLIALAPALARDWLRLREAVGEAIIWHEAQDKALSKQPPSGDRGWRRNEHQEQAAALRAALAAHDAARDGAGEEG